jgi:hypothetical protein
VPGRSPRRSCRRGSPTTSARPAASPIIRRPPNRRCPPTRSTCI